jgi:hypothetical protein
LEVLGAGLQVLAALLELAEHLPIDPAAAIRQAVGDGREILAQQLDV